MTIQRSTFSSPLEALLALHRAMTLFEHRYQMSSETFYDQYRAGLLGDTRDFVEWAGDYQHYQCLKTELEERLEPVLPA